MAKRKKVAYWKNVYREAIEYLGAKPKSRASLNQLKQQWSKLRKTIISSGVELPRVQTVAKRYEFEYEATPRNSNMETLPAEDIAIGYDFIETFKKTLEQIYNDTISWTQTPKDPHAYLASLRVDELTATYRQILLMIDDLVLQYGYDDVAEAIASDVELDYTIALVFVPPSSVQNEMEMTLDQLKGIILRLETKYESI